MAQNRSGMISPGQLLADLRAHPPQDAAEEASLARLIAFVAEGDPFRRGHPVGHVTGSALVARPHGREVLLVHHRRLDRWLQPGGHTDPEDASVFETARREAREETGVERLEAPFGERILGVDVHEIPARPKEAAHLHFDVRYLLTTEEREIRPQALEVRGVSWFSVAELSAPDFDLSVIRLARRAAALLAGTG
jgi:8-oxo-dGTP pyrophosphatase MutT (NUDIX family)